LIKNPKQKSIRRKHRKKNQSQLTPGIFLSTLAVIFFAVHLVQSIFTIQITEFDKHTQAASASHYKRIVEQPKRGSIFDRNGNELAFSIVVETVGITPSDVKSLENPEMTKEEIARGFSEALNLDYDEVLEKMNMHDASWVLLKRRIEREESENFKKFRQKYKIGGIKIDEEDKRVYPQGRTAGNIIGFVSPEGIGQLGLEFVYNSQMTGEPGYTYSETDNYGNWTLPFSVPISLRARDGYNIISTLDLGIQKIIEEELNKAVEHYKITEGGISIVMDPYTGNILGMANTPGFDPSNPTDTPKGIDPDEWNKTTQESIDYLQEFVWRNKAITNTYEPGSTFKALTAAMAMEEGKFFEKEYLSNAPIQVADWTIQNLLWNYHGLSTSEEAFWRSSNPIFVQLSQRIGVSKFYEYVRGFGFATVTGIDLPGEAIGIFHQNPKEIDMAVLSFGEQSTVTPLAMITSYSAFANGGYLMKPKMVRSITDSSGNVVREIFPETVRQVVSEQTAGRMRNLLKGVVLYGTGSNAYIPGYSFGGKTSTSTREDGETTDISFLGLAPVEQAQFVILTVLFAPDKEFARSSVAANTTGKMTERILEYLGVPRDYSDNDLLKISATHNVPDIIGMTYREAAAKLGTLGFMVNDAAGTMKENTVIKYQWPDLKQVLHRGGTIAVYASASEDKKMSVVPDVTGKNVNESILALTESGINIIIDGESNGFAISQEFEPGKVLETGSTVIVKFEP